MRSWFFAPCLLVLALGCAAPMLRAAAPSPEQVLAQLATELHQRGEDGSAIALRGMIAQDRFPEAAQFLTGLKLGASPQAVRLIDELREALKRREATLAGERNATIQQVFTGAADKFLHHAPAGDYDALLTQLSEARRYEPRVGDPSYQQMQLARDFVTKCQDYTVSAGNGSTVQAMSALQGLIEIATRVPVLPRSQLLALQARMRAAPQPPPAQLPALRARLIATIDSATSAADFDGLLRELANTAEPSSYADQRALGGLRSAARKWQEYYNDTAVGDTTGATDVLRELVDDPGSEAIYPRSKILARLSHASPTAARPGGATLLAPDAVTAGNLDVLVNQLAMLPRNGTLIRGTAATVEAVAARAEGLREAALALKGNDPQPALAVARSAGVAGQAGDYTAAFDRIERELLCQALAMALSAPAAVKPHDADSAGSYLDRVLLYGRDHKDWQLVYRAFQAEGRYNAPAFEASGAQQVYTAFFTARNLERAGQWADAVRSYESALRYPTDIAPSEEIGARVRAIKAAHPQDFAPAEAAARRF